MYVLYRFASKEAEVRALVEGQFMAKRIHADQMGLKVGELDMIIAALSRQNSMMHYNFSANVNWE